MLYSVPATSQSKAGEDLILSCYHCGSRCPAIPVREDKLNFCCDGCAAVYHLLKETQLCDFYKIAERPGIKSKKEEAHHYAFLDEAALREKIVDFSDGKTSRITFYIPNIHCSSCIWLLERLHKLHPGFLSSQVNFPRKQVEVVMDETKIRLSEVAALLDRIGYAPHFSLDTAEKKKTKPGSLNRKQWLQLGIAGFCFGNIMLLAFPEYLSLKDPAYSQGFRWVSLLLSLPVVTFCAWDYYVSSWKAIRQRWINIDLPIALGFVVIFLRSAYDVMFLAGPGYFDSLTGLIFFLLIGKAYQAKTYATLSFDRDYKSYFPIAVTCIRDEKEEVTPVSSLKTGDHIRVRNGELIPADSLLLSAHAAIDYSFVTGESAAVNVIEGNLIYAGGRQTGPSIDLRITKDVSQSYLTQLWNSKAFEKKSQDAAIRWTDRIGRYFTWGVLVIAAGAALYWFPRDTATAWNVLTTILVVACPCAVSLATPFTLGSAIRYLSRNKFYLKSGVTVEKIAAADTIVFDKTGTLTHTSEADLQWTGTVLTEAEKDLLSGIFAQSTHPLSRSIAKFLGGERKTGIHAFSETKGKGIAAFAEGHEVLAGSVSFAGDPGQKSAGDGGEVWVRIDGTVLGRFVIHNAYRKGIAALMKNLHRRFHLAVLSGDNDAERAHLTTLMPAGTDLQFHKTPEQKLAFISDLKTKAQGVIMVGDGLNDAGALAAADAGISVAEDATAFTPASDAILAASELHRLPQFSRFCRAAMRIVYCSFIISFGYNLFGLGFALTGKLTPLFAAILMPASSVSVVLFVTLGTVMAARKLKL